MEAPFWPLEADPSRVTLVPAVTLEADSVTLAVGGVSAATADRAAEASSIPAPQVEVVQ